MNKNKAIEKMIELVNKALIVPKKRLATKPSKGQKQKRLDTKKKISEKKENRKFKF
jgi:ribosome-associated protein